jgi:hypothetical protein
MTQDASYVKINNKPIMVRNDEDFNYRKEKNINFKNDNCLIRIHEVRKLYHDFLKNLYDHVYEIEECKNCVHNCREKFKNEINLMDVKNFLSHFLSPYEFNLFVINKKKEGHKLMPLSSEDSDSESSDSSDSESSEHSQPIELTEPEPTH